MADGNAFTAGVKPGGLTSSTEIRLLLCYLVCHAGPIAQQELESALLEEALVNYFEIGSCLEDIQKQGLVTLADGAYTITPNGQRVARELAGDLPRSVRDRAVAAVLKAQTWTRKQAEYSARILQKGGHYTLECRIHNLDRDVFCLTLAMPDRMTAEWVKKRFILRGNEVYQLLVNKLTEDDPQP